MSYITGSGWNDENELRCLLIYKKLERDGFQSPRGNQINYCRELANLRPELKLSSIIAKVGNYKSVAMNIPNNNSSSNTKRLYEKYKNFSVEEIEIEIEIAKVSSDKSNYEKRIVAFIDILGFKNQVEETISKNNTEKIDKTNNIKMFIEEMNKDYDNKYYDKHSSREVTQFSDSIVISFKFDEKASVFNILLSLMYLQISAIKYGILIRGGISVGLLCHTKKLLFGPAMNEAYFLESKEAIFPRIILKQEIIDIGFNNPNDSNTPEYEERYIRNLLKKCSDKDYYFIDYFESVLSEFDFPEYDYPLYLEDINKIIIKNKGEQDPNIIKKFDWLATHYKEALKNFDNGKVWCENKALD